MAGEDLFRNTRKARQGRARRVDSARRQEMRVSHHAVLRIEYIDEATAPFPILLRSRVSFDEFEPILFALLLVRLLANECKLLQHSGNPILLICFSQRMDQMVQ